MNRNHPLRCAQLLFAVLLLVTLLAPGASAAEQKLQIALKTNPDPPRSGNNTVVVTLLDSAGAAIADAAVEVRFYMAAMPSMNMPEMSASFPMTSAGKGRYTGSGKLVMGGTWEATVTVTKKGVRLARKKFTVNARG
jgi:Cu(I)/Ag(I) efflux system membrane fusion protein